MSRFAGWIQTWLRPALIAAMLCVTAVAPGGAASKSNLSFSAISARDARLKGVWQSQGYGWILDFTGPKLKVYNFAQGLCQRDPQDDGDTLFVFYRLIGQNTAEFTPAPNETRYRFVRRSSLPASCNGSPPPVGAFMAATFAAYYPGFAPRKIDRAVFLAQLRSADALDETRRFDAFAGPLASLSDAHIELEREDGQAGRSFQSGPSAFLAGLSQDPRFGPDPARRERVWLEQYRKELLDLLGPKGKLAANNRIFWGRIGTVGYLNILTMGGYEENAAGTAVLDAALDEALGDFAGLSAVIVDVSNNRGGYDAIGRHIAARFARRETHVYAKRGFGGTAPWQHFSIAPPSGHATFSGPVWLVTSEVTVSAGESFTLAMRALPNVIHLGQTTRGDLSDKLPKRLANGWSFALPAELYRDSRGIVWEGRGIPPRQGCPITMDRHAAAIAALVRSIESGNSGRCLQS